MKNALMISVSALSLIAGSNIVSAQEKGGQGAQPSTQSAPDTPQKDQNRREPEMKRGGDMKGRPDAPAAADESGKQRKPQRAEERSGERNGKGNSAAKPENQTEPRAAETPARNSKPSVSESAPNRPSTTGQGAAGATKPSAEQRTKISTTIRQQNVRPQRNVNFTVAIGTKVPRSGVKFYRLPATVISLYPEWRGYDYILVGNEILVIHPRTREIVDVIPA